nr:hypothetical protein [Pseudomonas fakonensis]
MIVLDRILASTRSRNSPRAISRAPSEIADDVVPLALPLWL